MSPHCASSERPRRPAALIPNSTRGFLSRFCFHSWTSSNEILPQGCSGVTHGALREVCGLGGPRACPRAPLCSVTPRGAVRRQHLLTARLLLPFGDLSSLLGSRANPCGRPGPTALLPTAGRGAVSPPARPSCSDLHKFQQVPERWKQLADPGDPGAHEGNNCLCRPRWTLLSRTHFRCELLLARLAFQG